MDRNTNRYNIRRKAPIYIEKRLADAKRIITNENLPPELSYDILKRVPGDKLLQFCLLDDKTRERCNDINIWNDKIEEDFGLSIPTYTDDVISYVNQLYSPANQWDYYLQLLYRIDENTKPLYADIYQYILQISSLVNRLHDITIDVNNSYVEDLVIGGKLRAYKIYLKIILTEGYKYGNMLNILHTIILEKNIDGLSYIILPRDEMEDGWYKIEIERYVDKSNNSGIIEKYYFYDHSTLLHVVDYEDNEETYEVIDILDQ